MHSDSSLSAAQLVHDGFSIRLIPANFSKRLLAYVVDLSIITVAIYAVFFLISIGFIALAFVGVSISVLSESLQSTPILFLAVFLFIVLLLSMLILFHGYFIYYESTRGYTPGKALFGLKVVDLNGAQVTTWQCILRDFMRYIDCMLIIPGMISFFVTERRQRLGDIMAGTMVVYSAAKESRANYLYIDKESYQYYFPKLAMTPLPEDIVKEFMSFAFRRFNGSSNNSVVEETYWLSKLRSHIQGELPDNNDLLIRLVAENCIQTDLQSKT